MKVHVSHARPVRISAIMALLAAMLLAVMTAVLPAASAHAAPGDSADLHVDPYLVDAKYRGIGVDIKILNGAVTDATSVRVTVQRATGPDVVKVSKDTGTVLATLNGGTAVTAPIVIQPGTYDEAGSSSWVKPDAIWTAETRPTSITVEVLKDDVVVLTKTVAAPTTGPTGASIDDVMPTPPTLSPVSLTYRNVPDFTDYKGISVKFSVTGFNDAEDLRITVDRSDGSSVVKIAKQALLNQVNDGKFHSLTGPIVVQQGTGNDAYNEAGSGSWYMPNAVWTSSTVPTRVTLTITRAYGPLAEISWTSIDGNGEGVLPAPSDPVKITVPDDQPEGGSFDVTIPPSQNGGELNLGEPVLSSVTVPVEINIVSPSRVSLTIPEGTTVTATGQNGALWDGVIELPTVLEDVEIPGSDDVVSLAIEVGLPGTRLVFDKPVKLVLAGQAGMRAGFMEDGVFTAIDTECSSSQPALTSGECWLNEGHDLVIWTTHFTTFVAYGAAAALLPVTGSEVAPLVGLAGVLGLAGVGLVLMGRRRQTVSV
jgi:LPXTG-motif cell wall-anchored protein